MAPVKHWNGHVLHGSVTCVAATVCGSQFHHYSAVFGGDGRCSSSVETPVAHNTNVFVFLTSSSCRWSMASPATVITADVLVSGATQSTDQQILMDTLGGVADHARVSVTLHTKCFHHSPTQLYMSRSVVCLQVCLLAGYWTFHV